MKRPETITCPKCGETKPAKMANFSPDGNGWFKPICKICRPNPAPRMIKCVKCGREKPAKMANFSPNGFGGLKNICHDCAPVKKKEPSFIKCKKCGETKQANKRNFRWDGVSNYHNICIECDVVRCAVCGCFLPATSKYFAKGKESRFRSYCRGCSDKWHAWERGGCKASSRPKYLD